MPYTNDETRLVSAVLEGAFESPPWSGFLRVLKQLTLADYVTLIFRPPGRPLLEAMHQFSGHEDENNVREVYRRYNMSLDFLSDLEMEEGRIYAFDELYPPRNKAHVAFFEEIIVPSGVRHCHMIRVMEPSGVSAWLTVSRKTAGFSPSARTLMTTITPILRGALRGHVALEREKFTTAVASAAMRRLHFAWIALDSEAQIIEHDPEAGRVFSLSGILSKGPSGRLEIHVPHLKSSILRAIGELASKNGGAQAFTLSEDPWLDMLILPASSIGMSANPRASVIAYVHGDSWHASDRCEELRQLFGLSRSEAKLAFALSRGMSISQAAEYLGIRIETARSCSKIIYGKTGARGLPDLVRIVMRSVLALSPSELERP